jgi:hypothetical protein
MQAQELVADVAMLEMAIAHLEEQIASLNLQLCDEQRERQKAESISSLKIPSVHATRTQETHIRGMHTSDYVSTPNSCSNSMSPRVYSTNPSSCSNPMSPRAYKLPHPSENAPVIHNSSRGDFGSPIKQTLYPAEEQTDFISRNGSFSCKHFGQKPVFVSPEKV